MDVSRSHPGWVEVITGSMFSGKSEELIRRLRRAQIARQRVQIFKPLLDGRYSQEHIVSHSDMRIEADLVANASEILEKLKHRSEVVGIDEGQFFDGTLVDVCNQMANLGKAGHRRRPRHRLPRQALRADAAAARGRGVHHQDARHLHALRESREPDPAPRRLEDRVVVGGADAYEARCRRCFEPYVEEELKREEIVSQLQRPDSAAAPEE